MLGLALLALGACRSAAPASGAVDARIRRALASESARAHALLTVTRLPSADEHLALERGGIRLLGWVPPDRYRAGLQGTRALAWLDADAGRLVSDVRPLDPAAKLCPRLARALAEDRPPLDVEVLFFKDVRDADVARVLADAGVRATRLSSSLRRADLSAEQVRALQNADEVVALVLYVAPRQLNDSGRQITKTDDVQQIVLPGGTYSGLTGQGIRIAIGDKRVDETHGDFSAPQKFYRTYASLPQLDPWSTLNPTGALNDHSTLMASVAAGSGASTQSSLPAKGAFGLRGHAPAAQLGNYPSFGKFVERYRHAIESDASDVFAHGWTLSPGTYSPACELLDRMIFGLTDVDGAPVAIARRPQAWGAGNQGLPASTSTGIASVGYFSILSPAKNVLTIGSCDARDGRVARHSSMGPTFDGRLKPELLAPGAEFDASPNVPGIEGAVTGGGYGHATGTSFATPAAAGIVALLMERAAQVAKPPKTIWPSTYKAILVATAQDLHKTADWPDGEYENPDTQASLRYPVGPDFATGFGLVDAQAATTLIGGADTWVEADVLPGDEHGFCMIVESGASVLQVALAWDDRESAFLPGNPTAPRLVNDLDLELVSPSGTVHFPWAPEPPSPNPNPLVDGVDDLVGWNPKATPRGVDVLNNVELATVVAPAPGLWRVRVKFKSSPFAETQCYSVASNAGFGVLCLAEEVEICRTAPWFCELDKYIVVFLDVEELRWAWPPEGLLDVNDVARAGGVQPLAATAPWTTERAFRIHAEGLTKGVELIVFDDRGQLVARAPADAAGRLSSPPVERRPGRRYAMLLTRDGQPLRETLRVRLDYEQL